MGEDIGSIKFMIMIYIHIGAAICIQNNQLIIICILLRVLLFLYYEIKY
jgi:hypothetical protein